VTDEEILDAIRARVAQGRQLDGDYQPELVRPATEDEMRAAERVIGFPLPPLLRRIYGEIANGGVGPFLGVEGLPGGYSSEYGEADDEREIGNTGYRRAGPTGAEFCCPVRASVGRVCRAMSSGVVPYQDCRSHILAGWVASAIRHTDAAGPCCWVTKPGYCPRQAGQIGWYGRNR